MNCYEVKISDSPLISRDTVLINAGNIRELVAKAERWIKTEQANYTVRLEITYIRLLGTPVL